MIRALISAVVFLASLAVNAQDIAKEFRDWEASRCSPQCSGLSVSEQQSVFELLYPSVSRVGTVMLRREPSFGYPTQIVITMGNNPEVTAFEIANPIKIPERLVAFSEHVDFIAWKYKTDSPAEIAKHFKVTKTMLAYSSFEPVLEKINELALAPTFIRSDKAEIVLDSTEYSMQISDGMSTLKFTSVVGARLTSSQRRLHRLFLRAWATAFPKVDFDSAE